MSESCSAWIIEDTPADLRDASALLKKLGWHVSTFNNVEAANFELTRIEDEQMPIPEFIVLDIDFARDSGFDILREWRSRPYLRGVKMIVWTKMGDLQQQLSKMFGVMAVVPKWAGLDALEEAVKGIHQKNRDPVG